MLFLKTTSNTNCYIEPINFYKKVTRNKIKQCIVSSVAGRLFAMFDNDRIMVCSQFYFVGLSMFINRLFIVVDT